MTQSAPNNTCFDCHVANPTWAVYNTGVFVCLRCAGIHRSLGALVSKVKSINLDSWSKTQVDAMTSLGNGKVGGDLEATLPGDFVRPSDSREGMEGFIKAKYVTRAYAKPGVA